MFIIYWFSTPKNFPLNKISFLGLCWRRKSQDKYWLDNNLPIISISNLVKTHFRYQTAYWQSKQTGNDRTVGKRFDEPKPFERLRDFHSAKISSIAIVFSVCLPTHSLSLFPRAVYLFSICFVFIFNSRAIDKIVRNRKYTHRIPFENVWNILKFHYFLSQHLVGLKGNLKKSTAITWHFAVCDCKNVLFIIYPLR